jgi:tight adherence protein C
MNNPVVLRLLQGVRFKMQGGKSVSTSVKQTLREFNEPYSKCLQAWLVRLDAGQNSKNIIESLPELTGTPAKRAFLAVIEKGLKGAPIDEFLSDLELEFYQTIEFNYEKRLQVLPLKMMMPLMLFVLPGMMLLLIGPLLFAVSQSF